MGSPRSERCWPTPRVVQLYVWLWASKGDVPCGELPSALQVIPCRCFFASGVGSPHWCVGHNLGPEISGTPKGVQGVLGNIVQGLHVHRAWIVQML